MAEKNYTDAQILFIINQRVAGYTFPEIAEQFKERYDEVRNERRLSEVFHRRKQEYDIPEIQKHPDRQRQERASKIVDAYVQFVDANKYLPTYNDLEDMECRQRTVRHYFGDLDDLDAAAREAAPTVFKRIIDEYSFNDEQFNQLKDEIGTYKRFVITSAVTGCAVHSSALDALKNYCKRNNAKLLVLPCSDPASNKGRNKWQLDSKLDKKSIVFRDLSLNSKFFLSTIKLSAKHINPLTGLLRLGQRSGSFCYASPKQALEYVATSSVKKVPRAVMTTGAITKAQYNTTLYMSERTAYIADHDHKLGAIVVEIKDKKKFFFRQLQIDKKTGAFYDIATKYFADGKIKRYNKKDHIASLVQLGDLHVGDLDPMALAVGKAICDKVTPRIVTVEDCFNGHSINPHDEGKLIVQAMRVSKKFHSLDKELEANAKMLTEIMGWNNHHQLVVKYGNHEDFLLRYLDSPRIIQDRVNYKRAINLSNAILNHGWKNPFEYAMRMEFGLDTNKYIKFLEDADDSFVVGGIENGAHGHLGPNGTRAPGLKGLEKCYGKANTGHTHSAGILRGIFRVGTSSYLKVSYNKGPSSWTQTHLIQHADNSRQLINCIDGEWYLK